MPGSPSIVLHLPAASPEAYLALVRGCREGAARYVGEMVVEELLGDLRWQLVDQAVAAHLDGLDRLSPRLRISPDLLELLTDHVSGIDDPGSVIAAAQLPPDAARLLDRCVRTLSQALHSRMPA